MYRGVVLCDHRPDCSDQCMFLGIILRGFSDSLLKLSDRNVPGIYRLHRMFGMSRGVVLCDNGPECSYRFLCVWKIFDRLI